MLTRNESFRDVEPELVQGKLERRERRFKAASLFVEVQKQRQHQVLQGQLALLQQLAYRRILMPAPVL
ncbi:MAG: hypothetical protein KF760_22010 [Candidatus Eremiobacteraeota bacterium]|nr:hypothetical protein [Candidatus Eremiobacteraeota bacterium]MCW5866548.1 hypothetical protein [Candidatus Eremiobacteraeota bacterium]